MWIRVGLSAPLFERVAAHIDRLIKEKRLRPGDRLPSERDLAEMLGISRPSLREAVKMMEATGKLRVKHGQGIYVSEPGARDQFQAMAALKHVGLQELFAMREVLEVPAAEWAATASREANHRHRLTDVLRALDAAYAQQPVNYNNLRRLDAEFHLTIAAMAGNRFLSRVMAILQDMLADSMETTLVIPGRLKKSSEQHRAIARAITSGNPRAARSAMRLHIRSAHTAALRRLKQEVRDRPRVARAGKGKKP